MLKTVLGVVAGLVAWTAIVIALDGIVRSLWPAYAGVAAALTFTLPMLCARLSISAVATLTAGLIAAFIAPRSLLAKLMPGVLLLVTFIPVHIGLWDKFPVWYHLAFLLSLVPLTFIGGTIWTRRHENGPVPVGREMRAL
jgi:uncharacterized membrane protein YeiB